MTDRAATGWLGVSLMCLYLFAAGGHYGGDGFWNYLTAQSLYLDQDLAIGERNFLVKEMREQFAASRSEGVTTASGRRYAKYGLALSLVEVPFYAAGDLVSRVLPQVPADYLTMFATSLTNVLICTLWVLVFFNLARLFGFSRRAVALATAAFAVGSMVFPYSGFGFSEPLLGLTLLASVVSFLIYTRRRNVWSLAAGSGLVGLAILTKFYAVATVPIFLFYLWPSLKAERARARATVALLGPLIGAITGVTWHNWVRYESMFLSGYHLDGLARQGGYLGTWPSQVLTAAFGFLFSPGRGLLFFLPLTILAPLAFRAFRHAHPAESRLFLGLIGVTFFPFLLMIDWHGGSCWGPRYLLPVLPFVILPTALLVDVSESGRRSVTYLAVAGVLAQVPGAFANPHLFVRFVMNHRLGDLLFYPGHPGDLLFSPYLSPIMGGYYQMVSGLNRLLAGESLNYVISSGEVRKIGVSLASYDLFDTWWINALRTGFLGPWASAALCGFALLLVITAVLAGNQVLRWSRSTG